MSDFIQSLLIGTPLLGGGLYLLARPRVIPFGPGTGAAGPLFVRFIARSMIGLGLFFLIGPLAYRLNVRLPWILFALVLVLLIGMTLLDLFITLVRAP